MKKLYAILLSIFVITNLQAQQWEPLYGPAGNEIWSFASFNNKLFMGTYWGTHYSTDNGVSWQKDTLTGMALDFAICGSQLFAAMNSGSWGAGGFYHSSDGINWQRIDTLGMYSTDNIVVDGRNIYFADYAKAYFSSDSGMTWQDITGNLPIGYDYGMTKMNNKVFLTKENQSYTHGYMYSSSDTGHTWIQHNTAASWPTKLVNDGANLFLGTLDQGMFLSADEGNTWQNISNGLPGYTAVEDIVFYSNHIYVATRRGLYSSPVGNYSWTLIGLQNLFVKRVFFNGNDIYAGTVGRGLFKSNDGGLTWKQVTKGIYAGTNIERMRSANNILWAAGVASFNYGLHKSTDNGETWQWVSGENFRSLFVQGDNIYGGRLNHELIVSHDGGINFTYLDFPVNQEIGYIEGNATAIYIPANNHLYVSYDSAQTWSLTPIISPGLVYCDNNITYVTKEDTIFRSLDNIHWTACNTPFSFYYANSMTRVGTALYCLTSEGMLKSHNGFSWIPTGSNTGIPAGCHIGNLFTLNNQLYSYVYLPSSDYPYYEGIFLSTDEGNTWSEIIPAPSRPISCMTVHNNMLFAGIDYEGVYRLSFDNPTYLPQEEAKASFFIFPNPTTGTFTINCPGSIINSQLKIYNSFGQLIHQQIIKSANQQIDLGNKPKGIYIVEAGNERRKIVLN